MMTAEQMHEATLFAVALGRMAEAKKAGEGVVLSAEETSAVVKMVQVLSTNARAAGGTP